MTHFNFSSLQFFFSLIFWLSNWRHFAVPFVAKIPHFSPPPRLDSFTDSNERRPSHPRTRRSRHRPWSLDPIRSKTKKKRKEKKLCDKYSRLRSDQRRNTIGYGRRLTCRKLRLRKKRLNSATMSITRNACLAMHPANSHTVKPL
jgi:hypothetical protein